VVVVGTGNGRRGEFDLNCMDTMRAPCDGTVDRLFLRGEVDQNDNETLGYVPPTLAGGLLDSFGMIACMWSEILDKGKGCFKTFCSEHDSSESELDQDSGCCSILMADTMEYGTAFIVKPARVNRNSNSNNSINISRLRLKGFMQSARTKIAQTKITNTNTVATPNFNFRRSHLSLHHLPLEVAVCVEHEHSQERFRVQLARQTRITARHGRARERTQHEWWLLWYEHVYRQPSFLFV